MTILKIIRISLNMFLLNYIFVPLIERWIWEQNDSIELVWTVPRTYTLASWLPVSCLKPFAGRLWNILPLSVNTCPAASMVSFMWLSAPNVPRPCHHGSTYLDHQRTFDGLQQLQHPAHGLTNEVTHAPSGFIGHASKPRYLFGTHTMPRWCWNGGTAPILPSAPRAVGGNGKGLRPLLMACSSMPNVNHENAVHIFQTLHLLSGQSRNTPGTCFWGKAYSGFANEH